MAAVLSFSMLDVIVIRHAREVLLQVGQRQWIEQYAKSAVGSSSVFETPHQRNNVRMVDGKKIFELIPLVGFFLLGQPHSVFIAQHDLHSEVLICAIVCLESTSEHLRLL